jgi:hypothetical protein
MIAASVQLLTWTGPFRIADLLTNCGRDPSVRPPEHSGVYLVSKRSWTQTPKAQCEPLYYGSNTGHSARFRTRIGDLIADMYGFWCEATGHHSGGQSLYKWCLESRVSPGDLYLGWATSESWCSRCVELDLSRRFEGSRPTLLNKIRPPKCADHPARDEQLAT